MALRLALYSVSRRPCFNRLGYGSKNCLNSVATSTKPFWQSVVRVIFSRTMSNSAGMNNTQDVYSNEDKAQDELLKDIFDMLVENSRHAVDRGTPIVKFKTPQELGSIVDFDISGDVNNHENLKLLCKSAVEHGVNSVHPRFFNQQYGGLDKYGLAGELVVSFMNSNLHTYEVAPFFVMAEKAVVKKTLKVFGYETGDGTFCPGGSYSSMMGTHLAKYRKCPSTKQKGLSGVPRMVMFASTQAHYSATKNAVLLGIGNENCIKIPSDASGKMIVSELEKAILKTENEGAIPFFAIATAGSTVLGSFDAFNEIADVCQKHGTWLHVDACWGGSAMLSRTHRHLCEGINRADSIAWNPHKMISMPLQCSMFLTKHKGLMGELNGLEVPYLFQPQKSYDVEYDIGRELVQCGRKCDSFKFWLAWKANGDEGFEKKVDKAFDNAQYLLELVKKREHFRLVTDKPQCTNVSFWFIPPSLRGKKEDDEFWKKMHFVAPKIKNRMQAKGSLLVGVQPVETMVNFFRMIVVNSRATRADMEFVLDEIEKEGSDL